ncbi:ATP-dependent protease ClpP, protease subunit [Maribacter dokdonensis]|uniref:ATP-dependent Clp protease proteolytic subunit n=1 Tax=Maribacter dokdonensis TaxID=320912 RepID=A0ABY0V0G9_9FLAO|nr:Clp protease ClpP [Maribacter dokdonensis]SDT47161.1 ATP-dependent protease ClpP, protease subunit [Maribacter dokdonensis]
MSKHTINIIGVIGAETTLQSVISSVKAAENISELEVVINSPGGSVEVGDAIHDYLKALDVPVITVADMAYSIAAKIFMAGSTRLVMDNGAPLMIHLPLVANFTGRAADLDAVSSDLKKIEKEFINYYSGVLELPEDTVKNLLENETFIDASEAVTMGFATGIKQRVEAIAFFNTNPNTNEQMSKQKKEKSLIEAIAVKLGIIQDPDFVALTLTTGDGETEIEFPELSEGETPEKGTKARVNGADAEGEIVMSSGDIFVFKGGELLEIKEAATEDDEKEEAEDPETPEANDEAEDTLTEKVVAKLAKKNEELEAEILAMKKLIVSPSLEDLEDRKKPKPLSEMTALEKRRYYKTL